MRKTVLMLVLLLVICFSLAARLDPWFQLWAGNRAQQDVLGVLLGEGRRIFANQAFVEADVYFHSGYYPTIFDDRQSYQTPHIAEDAGAAESHNTGEETMWIGPPRDWIDWLNRHMYPSHHTHLDQGGVAGKQEDNDGQVREILPWLRMTAELDPSHVETYTVASYWLRKRMHRVKEAEQFLIEGRRSNPDSYEILFEMGLLQYEDFHSADAARHLWQVALQKWMEQKQHREEPDPFTFCAITLYLADLEEKAGHIDEAIRYQELRKTEFPHPERIDAIIRNLQARLAATNNPPDDP